MRCWCVVGLLMAGCGASSATSSGEQGGANREQGQSFVEAMHIVCVDGPQRIAGMDDVIQAAADYGRYLRTNVTNQQVYEILVGITTYPVGERGPVVDEAARRAGLADCSEFPIR